MDYNEKLIQEMLEDPDFENLTLEELEEVLEYLE